MNYETEQVYNLINNCEEIYSSLMAAAGRRAEFFARKDAIEWGRLQAKAWDNGFDLRLVSRNILHVVLAEVQRGVIAKQ